jgi:hypothetical protein
MGGVDWVDLARDRDMWRAVNLVMNLQVLCTAGNFKTS